mgnify:CR=1 FL=1
MSSKITIIGAGSVGSTIAYTLAMENSGASDLPSRTLYQARISHLKLF